MDIIFILGSVSLTCFVVAAANGGHHLLPIAARTIEVAAINGLASVFFARFVHDKRLAIIGTIVVTELIIALGILLPIAYRSDVDKTATEMGPLLTLAAVIFTTPMVSFSSVGFVGLVKKRKVKGSVEK